MDQLGQAPSKILVLSLLLSLEAHRVALMKVPNVAHVMRDITVDQFDNVVANITARHYLGFNDAELHIKGATHNKAFHILVTCMDTLLFKFIADTSSSLNLMPKNTLS